MDFSHSPQAQELMARVQAFMDEHIIPNERRYLEQIDEANGDWTQWQVSPLMEEWKEKAKQAGLWNLFLPDAEYGAGLTNRDYAPLAEIMG
ncbi:MAG: acyl-CoA dehydrogenase, partial [Ketobacter sp.]